MNNVDYVQQNGGFTQGGGMAVPAGPYYPQQNQHMGWSCPRCGRCYAPSVEQCRDRACQPPQITVPYQVNEAQQGELRKAVELDADQMVKAYQEELARRRKQAFEIPDKIVRQGWEVPVGGCGQESPARKGY